MEQKARFDRAQRWKPLLPALAALVALSPCDRWPPKQAAGAAVTSSDAVSYHAAATLTGPITAGHVVEPVSAHTLDLAADGYDEREFFASGSRSLQGRRHAERRQWTVTPTRLRRTRPGSWCADPPTPRTSTAP